jgi:hypothetical protein
MRAAGGVSGSGSVFAINANGDNALATLRYRLRDADMQAAEEPFESGGVRFARGSFIIRGVPQATLHAATTELNLKAHALAAVPSVPMHPLRAARVAIVHGWSGTQTEGWWRIAFDQNQIPFDYISWQDIGKTPNLASRWDVLVVAPGGPNEQAIIDGMPMWRNPIPWKQSEDLPNVGTWAQTDDIRPGMGLEGLIHLREFVKGGGVLIGAVGAAQFWISMGYTNGVSYQTTTRRQVEGTLLRTRLGDTGSPISYGIMDNLAVYTSSGETFGVSNTPGGRGGGGRGGRGGGGGGGGRGGLPNRATGTGRADDPDVVQGRPVIEPRITPPQRGTAGDSAAGGGGGGGEGRGGGLNTLPPDQRPRAILRYADQARDLLVSGLLDGGEEIVGRPNVVDSSYEKGHVVLFSFNPMWRGETIGSYALVFNTILNWDSLGKGR